ncbi:hypothetical protein CCR87_04305 [Rhodobaculum claviforme]|uniref:Glycosyltransferase subfamily 4-like N-terminal domain-containing protein n=1 Tax=Rhodobaculum claviforme TaxID=1549854 RepID=A0A934TK81_9RHOB|nr:hypothetical protein [Rhodobaculum claviforme]
MHFAIPGDLATPSGGYGYDRALIAHLPAQGWRARVLALPGGFPMPDRAAMAAAAAAFAALPDGAVVLADGLAFGVLDAVAQAHAARLRLVALVHHPLADETGVDAATAARLTRSERSALATARAVVCTSQVTADRLVAGFGVAADRITVAVPGTAAPAHPAPGRGDPPTILSVGSLTRRKGHDVLIAALAALADLSWRARIVGPAPDPTVAAALAAQIAAAGLQGRITLAGPVADAGAEYAGADIFALASRHEGFGMAYAEALAHGLPVVATRVGPVAGFVPADAGGLVAPDDAPALAAALGALLRDPATRRRAAVAAARAGAALPGWDDTAARVARVLDGVMS